jgi:hypothetical protein
VSGNGDDGKLIVVTVLRLKGVSEASITWASFYRGDMRTTTSA